jgi:DNA-dependent RNA polymerase auxiliary subunit epsilon
MTSSYDLYTMELTREANDHTYVLDVLKRYQSMGDHEFARDLGLFLIFPLSAFDSDDQIRLTDIIADIRDDQECYDRVRLQVNNAIFQMETYDRMPVNEFARSLYVNTLRGTGFFERYDEDVHYALQDFNIEMRDRAGGRRVGG